MPVVAANRLLLERPSTPAAAAAGAPPTVWAAAAPANAAEHPWDQAHRAITAAAAAPAAVGAPPAATFAEPDFEQAFPFPRPASGGIEMLRRSPCEDKDPDGDWPIGNPAHGWHLDGGHSRLKEARDGLGDPGDGNRVRVGILDTGYDPVHASIPLHVRFDLQKDFADGDDDASDPNRHLPGNQPGHGTATLALLAGRKVLIPETGFDDFLGGAPHAEVVPVRIANSVIHFRTGAMADGIRYATQTKCRVLSISMGGIPSRAWARAVNEAYDAGVAIFAAAGNHFGPTPPRETIWPARFGRVVAVCGVTADGSPYFKPGLHSKMHGCFGPPSVMGTAMAAYTPNAPWALMGCVNGIGFAGGTSSATPQCAAAAALWFQKHPAPAGAQSWQRVEAVRHAMFSSADRSHPQCEKFYGRGVLKAVPMLAVPFRTDLPITPPDSVSFPWLRLLGPGPAAADPFAAGRQDMFEVEALQVFVETQRLQELAGGADPIADKPAAKDVKAVLDAMRKLPGVSKALRAHLDGIVPKM